MVNLKDYNDYIQKEIIEKIETSLPPELNNEYKEFLLATTRDFLYKAVRGLINMKTTQPDRDKIETFLVTIADTTYRNGLELFDSKIPQEYWSYILQTIAGELFEAFMKSLQKNSFDRIKFTEDAKDLAQKYSDQCAKVSNNPETINEITIGESFPVNKKASALTDKLARAYPNFKRKPRRFPITQVLILIFVLVTVAVLTGYIHWIWFLIITFILGFRFFIIFISWKIKTNLDLYDQYKASKEAIPDQSILYSKIRPDLLAFEYNINLLKLVDPAKSSRMSRKISDLRQKLIDEIGFVLPYIKFKENNKLKEFEFSVLIREASVLNAIVYPDRIWCIKEEWDRTGEQLPEDVKITQDPVYSVPVYWFTYQTYLPENLITYRAIDYVVDRLEYVLIKNVSDILSLEMVEKYLQEPRRLYPALVREYIDKKLTIPNLREILVNLIRERVPVRDMVYITERLCYFIQFYYNIKTLSLTDALRTSLGRHICLSYCDENKVIHALTLSTECENFLNDNMNEIETAKIFLISSDETKKLYEEAANKVNLVMSKIGKYPVILCSPRIRLPLYELLCRHIPDIVVMAYSELAPEIEVKQEGVIEYNVASFPKEE